MIKIFNLRILTKKDIQIIENNKQSYIRSFGEVGKDIDTLDRNTKFLYKEIKKLQKKVKSICLE